jgi:hypothetical protein
MERTAPQLLETIHRLMRHHELLIAIEREKVSALVQQDWKGLERLVQQGRKVLKAIEETEAERLRLVQDLGGTADSTLAEVVGSLPPPGLSEEERILLTRSGEKLRGLIVELEEWASRAQALIQSSLEVVNFSIALFSGAVSGGKTYGVDGAEKNLGHVRTSLVFDAKA